MVGENWVDVTRRGGIIPHDLDWVFVGAVFVVALLVIAGFFWGARAVNALSFAVARQTENDAVHDYYLAQGEDCTCGSGMLLSLDARLFGAPNHAQEPVCDNGRQYIIPKCVADLNKSGGA